MWWLRANSARWMIPAAVLVVGILGSASVSLARPAAGTCPIGGYTMPACPVDSDQVTRDQVVSRLSGSVTSAKYPITVGVCNGVVTLQGMVQTSGKRDLANLFAWSVRGVIDVRNNLTIDPNIVDDMILLSEVKKAFDKSANDGKRMVAAIVQGLS